MTDKVEIISRVEGGKIAKYSEYAQAMRANEGQLVKITIERFNKKRSVPQNAAWFARLTKYALPYFKEYGDNWSVFAVHEYIMNALGYQDVRFVKTTNGMMKPCVQRKESKKFTTIEWEEFMDKALAFLMSEHGIAMPLPNEELETSE